MSNDFDHVRPPGLPSPGPVPVFVAPPGGARTVSARARRRRMLEVGVLAGTAAVTALVTMLTVGVSDSTASLRPGSVNPGLADGGGGSGAGTSPSDTPTPSADPSASSTGDPATGSDQASPGPDATTDPSADPSAGDGNIPPPNDDPDAPQPSWTDPPSPQPSVPEQSDDVVRPMTRSTHAEAPGECDGATNGSATTNGWCIAYTGATSTPWAHEATLTAEVCRLNGQGAGTLHFTGALEVDFGIDDNAGNNWEWSTNANPTGGAHSLAVAANTCVQWSTVWPARDDDGLVMPKGGYTLSLPVAADNLDVSGTTHIDPGTSFSVD